MSYTKSVSPQRTKFLKGIAAFAKLPDNILEILADKMEETRFNAGTVIVAEGDITDHLYLIERGRAEVSTMARSGTQVLVTLSRGELFGEMGLTEQAQIRQTTVTAITTIKTLVLSGNLLRALLEIYPEARRILTTTVEDMDVAKFLKQASPFTKLKGQQLRWLASRLERINIAKGATIVQQGEMGDACYLIHNGQVEVVVQHEDAGEERYLTTLNRGALFGEAALLTASPRNATVRALQECELLKLKRSDLLEAVGQDRVSDAPLMELLQLRARPKAIEGIIVQNRTTADGETITILKNPQKYTYYRLSAQGWFVWQQLDGRNTLRDLALLYLAEFKAFAPGAVVEIISGLSAAGFLENKAAQPLAKPQPQNVWEAVVQTAQNVLVWNISLHNVDKTITALYKYGLNLFFKPLTLVLTAIIALSGFPAFLMTVPAIKTNFNNEANLLWFLIPAYFISILLHEAGHAFTVKAFGREINRVGVGWYWFGPVAFVDTSDMWQAGRWPRIAVSLAGPYTNMLIGSISALSALFLTGPGIATVLWQFALTSYLIALANLNPLFEYDGYYVLMDWLERPNLRKHCLHWLGFVLPKVWNNWTELFKHRLELAYGLGAILFTAFMAWTTLLVYRLVVQDWLSNVLPASNAANLAWLLAGAVAGLSIIGVLGEVTGRTTVK